MIILSVLLIDKLKSLGITTDLHPGSAISEKMIFEPPCSLKRMQIENTLFLGAFSYGVSGFYHTCHIGRYCSFGEDVQIGRHAHPMHWASTSPFFYMDRQSIFGESLPPNNLIDVKPSVISSNRHVYLKSTTIGNDVWIGHGAFILPGINIGDGAVIAARSVVTKNVPPYAIVAGTPAKVVRFRFPVQTINLLIESRWWEYSPSNFDGVNIEDIDLFLNTVSLLRGNNVPTYNPEPIDLGSLFKSINKDI